MSILASEKSETVATNQNHSCLPWNCFYWLISWFITNQLQGQKCMVYGWYTSIQSEAPEIAKLTYNLLDKDHIHIHIHHLESSPSQRLSILSVHYLAFNMYSIRSHAHHLQPSADSHPSKISWTCTHSITNICALNLYISLIQLCASLPRWIEAYTTWRSLNPHHFMHLWIFALPSRKRSAFPSIVGRIFP